MSTPAASSSTPALRRKRSRAVALSTVTAMSALSLSACDDLPNQPVVDEVEQSRQQLGEGVDALDVRVRRIHTSTGRSVRAATRIARLSLRCHVDVPAKMPQNVR